MTCPTYGKYHTFDVPVEGAQHSRRCACGQPQRYKPPTGRGVEFTDVLVDAADLAVVLELHHSYEHTPEQLAVLERVQALLDSA